MSKKVPKRAQESPSSRAVPKMQRADRPSAPGLQPRKPLTPSNPDVKLLISLARVDVESRWCLSKISASDHIGLLRAVRDFESMTVNEVVP